MTKSSEQMEMWKAISRNLSLFWGNSNKKTSGRKTADI